MDSETKIGSQTPTSKEGRTKSWVRSSKWGYIASVVLLPYAIFKTMWAFGVPVGATENAIEDMHITMETYSGPVFSFLYQYGIDITALLAVIAIFLSLALVRPWGQCFPMWIPIFKGQRVPRWFVLFPAWTGGVLFTVFGGFSVFELILLGLGIGSDNMDGLKPWVFMITYGGFFIWGLTTCLAALSYQIKTRNIKAENN